MRAIVVFSDRPTTDWWDTIFRTRPGFRHCWICIETEGGWIELNPRSHWLEVDWLQEPGYDLAAFYRRNSLTLIETRITEPRMGPRPVVWWSCVEVVKAALGMRAWWCWTPYQLWKRLDATPDHATGGTSAELRREAL